MSNSYGSIKAPVRTSSDVASVLNVNSNNVGYLCKNSHGKTNKWSKFKPVRYAKDSGLTEAEFKSVNYGLIPTSAVVDNAYNLNEWTYNAPRGGSSEPYRLGDFRDYNHKSKPPIYILSNEPTEDNCTVITWDEGLTKIEDFKILAAYKTSSKIVGPPSSFGMGMDEMNFGATANVGNCTFGLLQLAGTVKMYHGANNKFNYDGNVAPYIDFSVNSNIKNNLKNIAVGSYLEVLPVIDTMDFSANKTSYPNSGLCGFPVGKKLRIYHLKSVDWYLTGINGNVAVSYITMKDTGATKSVGTLYYTGTVTTAINKEYPADPENQYYFMEVGYNIYNNRNYSITLNYGAFYLVIGGLTVAEANDLKTSGSYANSVTLSAKTTTKVTIRFIIDAEDFNTRFQKIPNLSSQPEQSTTLRLAFRNSNNLVTMKDTSGNDLTTQNWTYKFKVNN